MADIRNADKPNAVSMEADWGEMIDTSPNDSVSPPASDGDTLFVEAPLPHVGAVGGSEHNSPGSVNGT